MLPAKAAKALRRFCLDCQGGSSQSVLACADKSCFLFPFRLCTLEELPEDARPLRAIRCHCLTCAEGRKDVRRCDAKDSCPLWSYRFGVLPSTFKRVATRTLHKKQFLKLPGM